jgi:cyclopropane-fatty-acyl-phospholipid synthase
MTIKGQKIAVIGSGVSGLSSAWLLQFHGAEVTLYESEATCGGHTLTDHTSGYPVDLGFQVYNLTTYPHFIAWMEHLGVESETSDMSFAISVDKGRLEWASHGLHSIFAQRKNCFDPSFLKMVWDVLRFGREAPEVLLEEKCKEYADVTLGQYLEAKKCALTSNNIDASFPCFSASLVSCWARFVLRFCSNGTVVTDDTHCCTMQVEYTACPWASWIHSTPCMGLCPSVL